MSSSSSSLADTSLKSLHELEAVNGKCLQTVQQRLATLRASLSHLEVQRAAIHHASHNNNTQNAQNRVVPSSILSSSSTYAEDFYTPKIVEVTTASSSKKKRGGKRGRAGEEHDVDNNHRSRHTSAATNSKAPVNTGDLDLSGLFGDDVDAGVEATTTTAKKVVKQASAKANTNNIRKPSSITSMSSSPSNNGLDGVDPSCILQLDVLDEMKRGAMSYTNGGASSSSSSSPLVALCFAAIEQGFSPSPPPSSATQQHQSSSSSSTTSTAAAAHHHQPLSGVALLPLDNVPRMRAVELFPHILSALESVGGRSRQEGTAVVGGVIQPECWHDTIVHHNNTTNTNSTRVSIPVGDLDPFSSHILLAHLRTERSKRAVGKPLVLATTTTTATGGIVGGGEGGSVTPNATSSSSLSLSPMTVATEAELANIVAAEHLFPSPYKGPRGHGITPSVLPRTKGSSGMKAHSSNWAEEEDELLMQLVLQQMRRDAIAQKSRNASLINPPPLPPSITTASNIDWAAIGTEMGSSFGKASVGANDMASWLRWENVLRPVVSSAALGAELSFEDSTYSPHNNDNGTSMKSSQQHHQHNATDSKYGDGDDNNNIKNGDMVVVEGSQRLRGIGEVFKGGGTNNISGTSLNSSSNKKYQSADAWPTADDEFLWALVRQANFKLDRAFWLRMKYVAPLRDSYAPFAILQRFQQFTNPLHCPTITGTAKTVTTIANNIIANESTTTTKRRRRRVTKSKDDECDDDDSKGVVSLSSGTAKGSGGRAAKYEVLTVLRTHEVLEQTPPITNTAYDDIIAAAARINDKYPTTYGFSLKNQFGVVDVTPDVVVNNGVASDVLVTTDTPPVVTSSSNTRPRLHPLIRKRSLLDSSNSTSPRRSTPGGTMTTAESMVFEESFTPISSTSPTTPSFPAAAAVSTTTTRRRQPRASQLNGWSTHELQVLSMLVKSFVMSRHLCIGGYHSSSSMELEDDDSWFGVDFALIHNDFTTLCSRTHDDEDSTTTTTTTSRHNYQQVSATGPLGGQMLEHSLQFHTKEQLRGVLRSLNSPVNNK